MIKKHLKSIFALMLCVVMILATYMTVVADVTPERIVFHVSTTGNDSNPGTAEAPFATIDQAAKAVAKTEHYGIPVDVLVHGGTYRLNSVVNIPVAASGSEGAPVSFKAAGDGEVIFDGFKDIDITKFGAVTDSKMKARFKADALPFIGALDLKAQGFDRNNLDMLYGKSKSHSTPSTLEYLVLLLNNKEQWICQWPNYGEFSIFKEVVHSGSGDQMPIVKYDDSTFDRWVDPSTAIVRGYLSNVYLEQWNRITDIDKVNKTLTFKYIGTGGAKAGRTWRVLNVPEELDVPGEYFVDVETMTLYFYPPYKISKDDTLRLSVTKDVRIALKEAHDITFDGFTFQGFRIDEKPHGLIEMTSCNNMQVRNCTFRYNGGGSCIQFNGYNNIIEANRFYNCGALGIFIYNRHYTLEDNFPNLEHENNQILNNHFYNTGNENIQGSGFAVSTGLTSWYISSATVGNVIKNNLIHHIYGGMNILYGRGNEWDISYNEIANGLRTLADYGLIYAGAREDAFGTQVNYNYLHDFVSALDPSYACNGIYFDDWISGQTANNNIIIAGADGSTNAVFSVGAYNTEKYNITATGRTGLMMSERDTKYGANTNLTKIANALRDLPDPLDKYDYMQGAYEKTVELGYFVAYGATVVGNVTVNAKNNIKPNAEKYGTVENNYVGEDFGIFVDHENHDWRIKADVARELGLDENIMTDENFSMDEIGIQKDVMEVTNPLDPFKQIYPKNGEYGMSNRDVQLAWEPALYADEYDYVVATDPEFKNIVTQGTTVFEFANIGDLDRGKSYYWKVKARNITRQIGAEWESEGVPFLFTTSEKDVVDKSFLKTSIEQAEMAFANIKDGTGKVGEFKVGTEEKFLGMLEDAKYVYKSHSAGQYTVDEMTTKLNAAIKGVNAFKNNAFVTFNVEDSSLWVPANTATSAVGAVDGAVSLNGSGTIAYKGDLKNYNPTKFRMCVSEDTGGWTGLTIRQANPAGNVYGGTQYLVIIKPDVFEFQKYNPGASATGILETKPNDGVIAAGEWYDIEFGAVDADGGVQIFFNVDGETIFDYYDAETPIYSEGYFCIKPNNGEVLIAAAESLPEGFYEPPADIATRGASIIYTNSSSEFSSEDKWESLGDLKGYNQKGTRVGKTNTASCSYLLGGKREDKVMFYYWHEAVEGGDPNANMNIVFNYDGSTEMSIDRKIDFSSGTSGWRPLGAFAFNDFGGNGTVKFTLTGSGKGKVVLPVIRKTAIETDYAEFAHQFYLQGDNMVALKIGSTKAFLNGVEMEIPDVAAQIIDSKTYLPLRFLSDAFGFNVNWDGASQTATVSGAGKTIELKPGETKMSVNGTEVALEAPSVVKDGRILLPVRDITEALGKTVVWNNKNQIVLVADKVTVDGSDDKTFDIFNNQFGGGK